MRRCPPRSKQTIRIDRSFWKVAMEIIKRLISNRAWHSGVCLGDVFPLRSSTRFSFDEQTGWRFSSGSTLTETRDALSTPLTGPPKGKFLSRVSTYLLHLPPYVQGFGYPVVCVEEVFTRGNAVVTRRGKNREWKGQPVVLLDLTCARERCMNERAFGVVVYVSCLACTGQQAVA